MNKNKCDRCERKIDTKETFDVLSVADLTTKNYPLALELFGDFYTLCKDCISELKISVSNFVHDKKKSNER